MRSRVEEPQSNDDKGPPVESQRDIRTAIVDYGLGNLYSVKHACEHVGMRATVTNAKQEILAADVVILPGVGAFGDAMNALRRLDLVGLLRDVASSGKVLMGVCLGLQLLMTESFEFGTHAGLAIIDGPVKRFDNPVEDHTTLKVPHVGWNKVYEARSAASSAPSPRGARNSWKGTPLEELAEGAYVYFVHSFFAEPEDPQVVLAMARYGQVEFCASLIRGNVFATQFHPERSGQVGLQIYRSVARLASGIPGSNR